MIDKKTPHDRKRSDRRRPYSPPAIRQEQVFETVAAGCAKFDPDPDVCGGGYKFSA